MLRTLIILPFKVRLCKKLTLQIFFQVSSLVSASDNNELKKPLPTPRSKRKTEEHNELNMNQSLRSQSANPQRRQPLPPPQNSEQSQHVHNLSQDSGLSPSPYALRFKHLGSHAVITDTHTPPPLPPKMKSATPPTNVFTPTLYVKNPQNYQPGPGLGSSNSSLDNVRMGAWRTQQRHRVEAQRNSLLFSSDEDEMDSKLFVEKNALNRLSAMELSQTFTEPFPSELDFSQIVNFKSSSTASGQPPPPPPRDPLRKLYLSSSPTCHRPVSYSFEKPDLVQQQQLQTHFYPSQKIVQVAPEPQRSREVFKDLETRQGRAASASSYFHGSVPDLVSHARQPNEYWKCPPPPYVPTFDPYLKYNNNENEVIDIPPPRPPRPNLRKKLSNTSSDSRGRDSAIGPSPMLLGGKSSPSSSSVTSRDSGCPELPPPPLPSITSTRPLSTLIESQLSVQDNDDEELDEEVEVIHCQGAEDSTATESWSPPRTDDTHPGFSSRQRRSLFRNAINEIEDLIGTVQDDTDLLDRAERRDLPTAHQELIAQGRLNNPEDTTTSLNTSNEMLFSDMDNFMNWNTSSSFENIPEKSRSRQRTPSRRRSGAIDKVTDDMVYRICRDNNKPVGNDDPGVKCNQSYLLMSPALTPASSVAKLEHNGIILDDDEPDVHFDDVHYRAIRDLTRGQSNEPDPPFGIPKEKVVSGSSNKDYLHAVPNMQRYRYT